MKPKRKSIIRVIYTTVPFGGGSGQKWELLIMYRVQLLLGTIYLVWGQTGVSSPPSEIPHSADAINHTEGLIGDNSPKEEAVCRH